jgi:hypothetical protein
LPAAARASASTKTRARAKFEVAAMSCLYMLTFDALFVVAAFILVFAIGLGLGMWKRG